MIIIVVALRFRAGAVVVAGGLPTSCTFLLVAGLRALLSGIDVYEFVVVCLLWLQDSKFAVRWDFLNLPPESIGCSLSLAPCHLPCRRGCVSAVRRDRRASN